MSTRQFNSFSPRVCHYISNLLEKIKQNLRLTPAPSLYYFTNGTRFTVKDDTSLSNAISQNHKLFTNRLTPQSSAILDNNNRFSYKYNPKIRVITFPVEAGIFPSEFVDYSDVVRQFDNWLGQMKTSRSRSCCMINGLVKSGKSVACYCFEIFSWRSFWICWSRCWRDSSWRRIHRKCYHFTKRLVGISSKLSWNYHG